MAKWEDWLNHVMSIKEGTYEGRSGGGYDNRTVFGKQFGEDGVAWCVIFDWCMSSDVGQASMVPKTDNVDSFTSWAKARGQWSQYPSIGAWVNFNNGEHTELVVGFDATYVYTKGGNTNNNGSAQGDGVYSHQNQRTAAKITGYFAPKFTDGVCPPTADPNDPRGGKAVSSYRYGNPAPSQPSQPSTPSQPSQPSGGDNRPWVYLGQIAQAIAFGKTHATGVALDYAKGQVLLIEKALASKGLLASQYVDGAWGSMTTSAYSAWQRQCGFSGQDANGTPGRTSLQKLTDSLPWDMQFRVGN